MNNIFISSENVRDEIIKVMNAFNYDKKVKLSGAFSKKEAFGWLKYVALATTVVFRLSYQLPQIREKNVFDICFAFWYSKGTQI